MILDTILHAVQVLALASLLPLAARFAYLSIMQD